jgi:hypothetical protein
MENQFQLEIEARGSLLIVTESTSEFHAIYVKQANSPQLLLMRRAASSDHELITAAFQAAAAKACELGWIL